MEKYHLDTHFQVKPGSRVKVSDFDTSYSAGFYNKSDAESEVLSNIQTMRELQDKLYAGSKYSVLIIFQAMDAAGKDGTIKHVISGVNPQGTQVSSFKSPTELELKHDFLWRIYKKLPAKGYIGIFNRSYYEEVLVVRVHPQFLLRQNLPGIDQVEDVSDQFWQNRFHQINNLEKHLTDSGTMVLKFFLNVSRDEQKKRFMKRIEDPARNWKFSMSDAEERKHWDRYMHAYSEMLSATSNSYAPWYVVPADKKWFMRMVVSNIITNKLAQLPLKYPQIGDKERARLEDARKCLESE
ncbi:polyphosphate kinase 2 family protein [Alkalitalea saponilacus]|uniref:Polyphosphate:nucleotide phosphotransferase, PPK2 family n=1 Tax=Alkalitalea saponilacus TaxID=889453 RepID=A0A1T5HKX3_9BACT|nr:polyphosphate kinase 2 family protein [Alkalitalea saponilacus]ASB47793.1 hypothetical protein CDL62_00815 [Alkalitalea saponilacus]SKC21279.1 polyphosphate:nucleotide phosphotransferase, PPK2 family [Alkalitalea saponilacus]